MRQNNAFSSLLTNVLPTDSNSTSPTGFPQMSPTTLLETFIPGYGPIHKFILYTLNIDITIVVSLVTVIWLSARDLPLSMDRDVGSPILLFHARNLRLLHR
jgi:chaperone BCS1